MRLNKREYCASLGSSGVEMSGSVRCDAAATYYSSTDDPVKR